MKLGKCYNFAAAGVTAAFLVLAVITLHDMQTAEGVGLYFALKAGRERLPFDVAVDILAALGLLLLVCLPPWLLKYRNIGSLLRCLLLFLSFMPSLSMAYLLHPLGTEGEFFPKQFTVVTGMVLPIICLWMVAGGQLWHKVCCAAAIVLFGVTLFVPSLQQLFYFVLTYLLLLVCFDLCERLWRKYPALKLWGMVLFGGLALRAFYVLSEILRKY